MRYHNNIATTLQFFVGLTPLTQRVRAPRARGDVLLASPVINEEFIPIMLLLPIFPGIQLHFITIDTTLWRELQDSA